MSEELLKKIKEGKLGDASVIFDNIMDELKEQAIKDMEKEV